MKLQQNLSKEHCGGGKRWGWSAPPPPLQSPITFERFDEIL